MPIERTITQLLRLFVVLGVVVPTVVLSVGMALAVSRAGASATQTVTSAHWGSVVVLQGASASTGPLIIDWSNVKKNPYQFIDLVNTSSLALVGQTVSVSTARNGSGNQNFPTISFTLCRSGTWDTTTGTCSGTAVDLGATVSGSVTIAEPVTLGGRLALRVSTTAGTGAPFTTTLSSAVSRAQIPVAAAVNS